MGLFAAQKTEEQLSSKQIEELVLDQMHKDPSRMSGPTTVKSEIARTTGIHITKYQPFV
jgi:hypothetical protein